MIQVNGDQNSSLDAPQLASRIYHEHREFIYRIISANTKERDEADDIFQNLFLSLVKNPPQNDKNIRGYLYRIIINDCIDATRRANMQRTKLNEYAMVRRSAQSEVDPSEPIIKSEEIEKIFTLIDGRLPSHLAYAIRLRYKSNCGNGKIAEKMDINRNSVRRYLSIGLKRIRQILKLQS